MFTAGGQPDLHVVMRGGGGKGGGGQTQQLMPGPRQYVDPQTGMVYSDPTQDQINNGYNMPSGADQLNQVIAKRLADQQAAATQAATDKSTADATAAQTKAAADQQAAQTANQNQQDFWTKRASAATAAEQSIGDQFRQAGLDPSKYYDTLIKPKIQSEFDSIQNLDTNPGAAFSPSVGTDLITGITTGNRNAATTALGKAFPTDYANTLIPDSSLDPYVSSAVSAQFDPLSSQLLNAQKRGTLNDVGYNAALGSLAQKRAAATSQVSSLGQNILSSDRSGINDIVSGAKTDVSALGPSDTFDPTSYGTRAQSLAKTDLGNLGGAITNAIGGTQFATLSDLLNTGGSVQGATNPTPDNPFGSSVVGPYTPDSNAVANTKRGIGSTGAF